MKECDIEIEHYNRKKERIDIRKYSAEIQKIVFETVKKAMHA